MALQLIQLTDTHLTADANGTLLGVPLRASLQHVVDAAQQHDPDLVLVTGDLSQDGTPASYAALGDTLAPLAAPCYGLPGNHDIKPALDEALTQSPFRADRAFTRGGWRMVLLDSAVPEAVHGRLTASTLDALDADLRAHSDRPTLVALHHAPVPVGSAWLDPINLHAPDDFRQVVQAHPQVRLVLFGHVHQTIEATWDDTHLYGCPSTCFQFAPEADAFALDPVPPGYRHVTLHPDGTFETTLHRVPVPFTPNPDAAGY
jgi:Icc protein